MTIFMSFQWLMGKIKTGSAGLASAVSIRTWVVRGSLSNRQMLKVHPEAPCSYLSGCKILSGVAHLLSVSSWNTRNWKYFLNRTAGPRRRGSSGKDESSHDDEPPGDGGPDEAARFIAETVAALARLARWHELGMLVRLLEMAQMEAEEFVRLRGKRNLS
jgi:hypothetical protein